MKNTTTKQRWIYTAGFLMLFILASCNSGNPEIRISEQPFSFGKVVNGQVLIKDLVVSNQGTGDLIIESVSTSCGCTTASLDSMIISPGKNANLHIEFDSGAHGPEANGEVFRQIFIASNDPQQEETVIEFKAVVLPPKSSGD